MSGLHRLAAALGEKYPGRKATRELESTPWSHMRIAGIKGPPARADECMYQPPGACGNPACGNRLHRPLICARCKVAAYCCKECQVRFPRILCPYITIFPLPSLTTDDGVAVRASACMHARAHTHKKTPHTHTHANTHSHTCIHTHMHAHKHTYIHTRIHTYIPTDIQTYTHTYTHMYVTCIRM